MKKILKIIIVILGASCLHMSGVFANEIEEIHADVPELFIKAVNPGYTIDKKTNVGEMIEIGRRKSDVPILLAGATVGYTNSSGNYSILFEFPENSWLIGESILLRLASSQDSELAAEKYTKTIAFRGGLSLNVGGEIVDEVCWSGKDDCEREFRSAEPTTLVRNLSTNKFDHIENYEPKYDEQSYYIEKTEEVVEDGRCKGLVFSEILSFYDNSRSEQFVEIYNASAEQILMDGCMVKYKNKLHELAGVVASEKYYSFAPEDFGLAKNPTNVGVLELLDINGETVDKLEYPNGQRRGTSYALIGFNEEGAEIWRTTYAPTPGEANNYQEFKSCELGKVINEETGNCVKVASVNEKICGEGQYLNLLTGRCRKIVAVSERVCKDGYVLNPETGRCRKIIENTGANYSLEPIIQEEKSTFVALYAVGGVLAVGVGYVIFEFRREIVKFFGKVFRRFRS